MLYRRPAAVGVIRAVLLFLLLLCTTPEPEIFQLLITQNYVFSIAKAGENLAITDAIESKNRIRKSW